MKKMFTFFIGLLFTILLSGCGADGSGAGGASGMAGGGSGAGMGTSGGLPIDGLAGGGSMGGTMDIGALMGGLMGGGGDDDDDDDSDSGSDDSATNTAPQAFTHLGQVGITYNGNKYPMVAALSRDRQDIIVPNYTPDVNGTNIIQIAAYDIREERLHEDTGSLIFSFRMADLEEPGEYPLITSVEGESGVVHIENTSEFNNHVTLSGYVAGATFYSPSKNDFYTIDMEFQADVYPSQPASQQ